MYNLFLDEDAASDLGSGVAGLISPPTPVDAGWALK